MARSWVKSPRARRRIVWLGALAAAGAVAGLVVVLLPNDKGGIVTPTSNEPVQQIERKRQVPLTAASRAQINALLDRFVPAAVARRDPGAAYDLVTPLLRAGTTRAQWRAGTFPAPTYDPSGTTFHGWRPVYSFADVASIELDLQPGPTESGPAAFIIDLRRIDSRWLVDGMYERAAYAGSGSRSTTATTATTATKTRVIGGSKGRLGVIWLLVPVGLLSLVVIVPAIVFLSGWIADRRVRRKYRHELRRELPPLPRPLSPPPSGRGGNPDERP